MAARVVDKLPEGDDWMYEVKFGGYCALLLKDGENVRIRLRNDKDLRTRTGELFSSFTP
jgi:bifunctional non-homologous end joining protein LigD